VDWPEAAHAAADEALAGEAAAYALGALPPAEARAYARHLEYCAVCRRLAAEQRATADLLPLTVDLDAVPVERLQRLRGEILTRAATLPAAPEPIPLRARRRSATPVRLALAAALVVAAGLLVWNLVLRRELDEARTLAQREQQALAVLGARRVPLTGSGEAAGAGAELVQTPGQGAVLLVRGLPPPPAGKVYEIWVIRGGTPVPAGTFSGPSHPTLAIPLAADAAGADKVAVSLEAAQDLGPLPKGPIVLAGEL
jgi:hypothetical protein